jgi:hypothetical protein
MEAEVQEAVVKVVGIRGCNATTLAVALVEVEVLVD